MRRREWPTHEGIEARKRRRQHYLDQEGPHRYKVEDELCSRKLPDSGAQTIPDACASGFVAGQQFILSVDGTTFDLIERFDGLKGSKTDDRQAVATALRKLLRRALEALVREEAASRR